MAKRVQFRRGNTDEHDAFVGAQAEVTVDTATHELVVHDGWTRGGFRTARKAFSTTAELLASREAARGVGEGWDATRHCFREAAAHADDHHIETAGGVKLHQIDDSADVAALGAPEGADPLGRQAYAPPLVASMRDRRLGGVRLRELVGRNYSVQHDAAAALSGFIAELAPAGIAIHDPDEMTILCQEPIRIENDLKLFLGANTTLLRGFADASSDVGALLSREDWAVDTSDMVLQGGVLKAASPSQTGKLMALYGDRWEIKGTRFLDFFGGQAIVFGGDDNRIVDCLFRSPTDAPGTGAVRMVGGRRFVGMGLHAFTGDDLFQFVPITNRSNARYDIPIADSYYIGCHGISRSARVFIAAIAGPQDEAAMTCTIRRVGWIGCSGVGGNRVLTVENTNGDDRVPRQIDDVVVSECAMDGSRQNQASAQDVLIAGSFEGAVGRVTVSNASIHGSVRPQGIMIRSPGAEVILHDTRVEGRTSAVSVAEPVRLTIRDGRCEVVGDGGPAEPHHVLDVAGTAGASSVLLEGRPIFAGVASGKAAVRISSEAASLAAARLEVQKASGASETVAVSHAPGAEIFLGDVVGSVDIHERGGGAVRREHRIGTGATLRVEAGAITITHPDHVVDGGDAPGGELRRVAFPAWAGNGQVFTLRGRRGGSPVTIRSHVANVVCPKDRTLGNEFDLFAGILIDGHLVETSFTGSS